MKAETAAAFRRTEYHIELPGGWVMQRIGEPCVRPLGDWLRAGAYRTGWLISAHNPGARPYPADVNRARHAVLAAWLRERGFDARPGINRAAFGDIWPDEASLLVAGLDEARLRALARRFGQLAVVVLPTDAPAALIQV